MADDDTQSQWQHALQAPVEIPTTYQEGTYQTLLTVEPELASTETV